MWDMHKMMRKVFWPGRYPYSNFVLIDAPFELTPEQLDAEIVERTSAFCEAKSVREALVSLYGFRDYIGFALRPLYHLFGKSTRNYGGVVCSGLLRDVARLEAGWVSPIMGDTSAPEPSPADWCRALGQRLVWVPEVV
jgi:hypothetical protein